MGKKRPCDNNRTLAEKLEEGKINNPMSNCCIILYIQYGKSIYNL
jgi:hypothetical protein